MFNFFGKKEDKKETIQVATALSGVVTTLESVPDPVFAGKMVGDGFAVEPTDGKVVAPISGEIVQFFPTNHAFGIRSKEGLEVLVHVGIDTVQLKGEGFVPHVKVGDTVTVGQSILTVDLEVLRAAGKSTITPIIVTNMTEVESVTLKEINQLQTAPTAVLEVVMKA